MTGEQITTVEELEALPVGSVVLTLGKEVYQRGEWYEDEEWPEQSGDWWVAGGDLPQRTVLLPALVLFRPVGPDVEDAFDTFVRSFNGDEAGDIDDVSALDGNTGWAMRGGNDVRAVFEKARIALTARPSVVTREQVETFARDVEADTFQLLAGMVPPVRDKYEHAIVSKYVEALRVHLGLPVEEESHD
jgi:hypothetical protein